MLQDLVDDIKMSSKEVPNRNSVVTKRQGCMGIAWGKVDRYSRIGLAAHPLQCAVAEHASCGQLKPPMTEIGRHTRPASHAEPDCTLLCVQTRRHPCNDRG